MFNEAFLAKQKLILGKEDKGIWQEVLESIYGSWRSLDVRKPTHKEYRWWKDLRNICGSSEDKLWLEDNLSWKLSSGTRILFWANKWIRDRTLRSHTLGYMQTQIKKLQQ